MSQLVLTEAAKVAAIDHLRTQDSHLAEVIARAGPITITPHQDYYRSLADSIIGQQLSVKAAATIKERFRNLFGGSFPTPELILATPPETLRTAGLSRSKAAYIQDLAQHIVDGRIDFAGIEQETNEAIIKKLTDVKGIGEWTAHMFLIFCMGRTDVLAIGDLGIRAGVRNLYGLDHLPSPAEVTEIAKHNRWHPYETVACWYIWYSLDNKPM